MNNFQFLNLMNPQIVKVKSTKRPELYDRYMVAISAFCGYTNILACTLYIDITEKLLNDWNGNEFYEFVKLLPMNINKILTGTSDWEFGKDYYVSETLFAYILEHFDVDDSSDSSDSSSSASSENSSSNSDSSDSSSDNPNPYQPTYDYDYIIIEGPDVIRTWNLHFHTLEWIEAHMNDNISDITNEINEIIDQQNLNNQDSDSDSTNDEPIIEHVTPENVVEILREKGVLPDFIKYYSNGAIFQNTDDWYDLFNTNNKDMANLAYFYGKNLLINNTFNDDDLNNIPKSFFRIILKHAVAQNYYTNINNQIYHMVMKYWANSGMDEVSTGINLILSSLYTTNTQTGCGCDVQSASTSPNNLTCKDMYDEAMLKYLKQMLGDINYYNDWFFIPVEGQCPMPNDVMIDLLITLLTEFLASNPDLSFNKNINHCVCPDITTDDDACNRAIIENYIKVLRWIKNNDIDANSNKIKIYGEQFGELLPKLIF